MLDRIVRNDAPHRSAVTPDPIIIRDAPREMKWAGRAIVHAPTGAAKNDDHQSSGMYTETTQSHSFQDDR